VSRFETHVVFEELPVRISARPFLLLYPVVYRTDVLNYSHITVPAGYATDFASIPRIFWRIFPPSGMYRRAALVHDWLVDEQPHSCDDKQAAKVFLEAMKDIGVSWMRRKMMYRAVRLFGPRFKPLSE